MMTVHKYIYIDNTIDGIVLYNDLEIKGVVVFYCTCNNKEEADKEFEDYVGVDPKKLSYVNCLSEPIII
jgi:hypothetical protein